MPAIERGRTFCVIFWNGERKLEKGTGSVTAIAIRSANKGRVTVPVPFSSGPYSIGLARRKKGDRHRAQLLVVPGDRGSSARSQSPFLRLPFSL
jgi:hypothetical protein